MSEVSGIFIDIAAGVKMPHTLRSYVGRAPVNTAFDGNTGRKVTIGCLIAVASIGGAKARNRRCRQSRSMRRWAQKAAVTKPSPEQVRVRAALRRAARDKQAAQAKAAAEAAAAAAAQARPTPIPMPTRRRPIRPIASLRRNSAEPIANTPKSITVLTKEILEDKDATSLKEVARTTAGVTLGTGEGGNAFGDRFFIRGFDARNDVSSTASAIPPSASARISSPSRSRS